MGKYIIVPNISYSLDNLGQLLGIDENILYGKAIIVRNASFASNNLGQVTFINEPVGPTGETEPVGPTGETEPAGPTGETGQTGPIEPDYSTQYFTIESLVDNNTISLKNAGCNIHPTVSYSLDDGESWSSVTITANDNTQNIATINEGEKIILKGTITSYATEYNQYNRFNGSKNFKVYGNAMSLIYGDNFINNSEFPENSSFNLCGLFYGTTTIIDATNLILPATNCLQSCYNGMFRSCTLLEHGPKILPATTAASQCYSSMFEACINLEEAPIINLVTLANQCCKRMFCMDRNSKITTPKLTKGPVLSAEHLVTNCYEEMFKGNGNFNEFICLASSIESGKTLYDCIKNYAQYTASVGVVKRNSNNTISFSEVLPTSGWTQEFYVENE